jgi:hypothetical protein
VRQHVGIDTYSGTAVVGGMGVSGTPAGLLVSGPFETKKIAIKKQCSEGSNRQVLFLESWSLEGQVRTHLHLGPLSSYGGTGTLSVQRHWCVSMRFSIC